MKAIDNQRIKRYLLYALGEVLLIFIGITLAVWFNAQKEEKKGRATKREILSAMHQDLKEDMSFLVWQRGAAMNVITQDSLMLQRPAEEIPLSVLKNAFLRGNVSNSAMHTNSYLELKNHPDKTLIENDSISRLIEEYYSTLIPRMAWWAQYDFEQVFEAEKLITFNDQIASYPLESTPDSDSLVRKIELARFFEQPAVVNHISHDLNVKRMIVNVYNLGMKLNQHLSSFIESELSNKAPKE